MLKYKNISNVTKIFYGVTFKPGDTHLVNGYINHPKFIRMPDDAKVSSSTTAQASKSAPASSTIKSNASQKTPEKSENKGG